MMGSEKWKQLRSLRNLGEELCYVPKVGSDNQSLNLASTLVPYNKVTSTCFFCFFHVS